MCKQRCSSNVEALNIGGENQRYGILLMLPYLFINLGALWPIQIDRHNSKKITIGLCCCGDQLHNTTAFQSLGSFHHTDTLVPRLFSTVVINLLIADVRPQDAVVWGPINYTIKTYLLFEINCFNQLIELDSKRHPQQQKLLQP